MKLQGIVAVSGRPGLWKALSQNKSGFVLESLDEKKTKLVANMSTAKLASLDEITIFGDDDDLKLKDILERMKTAAAIPDVKADGNALRKFFREVATGHDEDKVYSSDIKKVISWFGILKNLPLFIKPENSAAEPDTDVAVEDNIAEKTTASKNPAAKTQPAK